MTQLSNFSSKDFRHNLYKCDNEHGNIFFNLRSEHCEDLLDEILSGLDNSETIISYKNNGGCILHLVADDLHPSFFSELRKAIAYLKNKSAIFEMCDIIEVYGYSCDIKTAVYSFIMQYPVESKSMMYRSDASC